MITDDKTNPMIEDSQEVLNNSFNMDDKKNNHPNDNQLNVGNNQQMCKNEDIKNEEQLSFKVKILYSIPSIGLSIVGIMVSTFVPRLYSDNLNVSIDTIGWISVAAIVFDGVSDPLIGYFSDYTKCKFGRRRPYLFVGGILLGISAMCLLGPPKGLTSNGLVAWASTFIIFTFFAQTLVRVPWFALGLELTTLHDEKTSLFATREVLWIFGSIVGASLPLVFSDEDERSSFFIIAILVAILVFVTTFVCIWFVTEPKGDDTVVADRPGWLQVYKNYWNLLTQLNRPGLSLLGSSTLYYMATSLNAFFFPYYITYVVDAEDELEIVLIIYIVSGIFFIPVWVYLTKKFEKFTMGKLAMIIQTSVLFIAFFVIDSNSFVGYVILVFFAGISFGGFSAIKFSMLSDVANYDHSLNPTIIRREGEIQGLFDLCAKLASASVIGPALSILESSGYEPNQTQGDASRQAIQVFYGLLPAIFGTLGTLALHPYNLTRNFHKQIVQ